MKMILSTILIFLGVSLIAVDGGDLWFWRVIGGVMLLGGLDWRIYLVTDQRGTA